MLKLLLTILLILATLYLLRQRRKRTNKLRELDLTGKFHKWNDLVKDRTYTCAICEEIISENILTHLLFAKPQQCIVCGTTCHVYCRKVKGIGNIRCKRGVMDDLEVDTAPKGLKDSRKLNLKIEKPFKSVTCSSKHQWTKGIEEEDKICLVCGQFCSAIYGFNTERCLQCQKARHSSCSLKTDTNGKISSEHECQHGRYSSMKIFPEEIKLLKPIYEKSGKMEKIIMNGQDPAKIISYEAKVELTDTDKQIVVFIINRLSGPQFGEDVLEYLYDHFNPCQVIDLLDGEICYLSIFKNLPNVRVVIGGGDGTVGSLGDTVLKVLGPKVPVIPMPLGTGNDLSRSLGWGPGISDLEDVKQFIEGLSAPRNDIYMDRWRVTVLQGVQDQFIGKNADEIAKTLGELVPNDTQKSIYRQKSSKSTAPKILLNELMNLYLGIGLDAKFSYQFNEMRSKAPGLFKSRVSVALVTEIMIGNKFMYSQMGVFNAIITNAHINKLFSVFDAEGDKVEVPESEDLIFLNTPFWGGGCKDIWASKSIKPADVIQDEKFKTKKNMPKSDSQKSILSGSGQDKNSPENWLRQKYGDKILECVSLKNVLQMASIQTGLGSADRVAQSRCYVLNMESANQIHIHIDGEGYMLKGPLTIVVSHSHQQLMNINEISSPAEKFQADVIKVLNWAVDKNQINQHQKEVLMEKFNALTQALLYQGFQS